MSRFVNRRAWVALAGLAVLGAASVAPAREPRNSKPGREVDLFQAMEDGLIEAKFIPRDSKQAKLIVTSKSDEPLTVRLPRTFAGVPVLAQGGFGGPGGAGGFGVGGGRGGAGNNQQGGGQNQGMGGMMGGGMGGMGMGGGMGGMGMGGGMFNIAPEKTVRMEAHCVCLEHGKEEPRPKVPYEIRPIDEFTDNADVQELLNLFATGQVNQRVVQAAAWHLANDMSWAELAAKQIEHVGRPNEPYFHPLELRAAAELAAAARIRAMQREEAAPAEEIEIRSDSDSLAAR